jgi:CheY-like chemotaxis protein
MKKNIILLLEDDELDVISVQRTLQKLDLDYEIYTAFNGVEGLKLLNDPKNPIIPAVILLDLNMPKMNGKEFLRAVRKDNRFDDTKVFVMTTSSESGDRSETEQLNISGYIIKPLSYTENTKRSDSMDAFVEFHLRKILGNQ